GRAELAAVNGPSACVVSGEEAAVLAVAAPFVGRQQRRLSVSDAFHSPAMEPMLAAFAEVARGVVFHAPQVAWIGGETGGRGGAAGACVPEDRRPREAR